MYGGWARFCATFSPHSSRRPQQILNIFLWKFGKLKYLRKYFYPKFFYWIILGKKISFRTRLELMSYVTAPLIMALIIPSSGEKCENFRANRISGEFLDRRNFFHIFSLIFEILSSCLEESDWLKSLFWESSASSIFSKYKKNKV